MNTEIHPLRRWLFEHQQTLLEFGERAGMAPSHLSEIMTGRKQPSLRTINKITEATSGALTANDFQQFSATSGSAQ